MSVLILNILMLIIRLTLQQNDGKLRKNEDLRHKIPLEAAELAPQHPS